MQKAKLIRIALFLFGIIAIVIGGALLLFPVEFESSSGIILDQDVNLLSEMRAYGGMLLFGGIIILLGAFMEKLMHVSIGVSCFLYLSIGLSRLFGMLLDGMPAHALVLATILELVIGGISLYIFLKAEKQKLAPA